MIRISIVIPAFNVGFYLNKCIDSILMQDISKSEIEVIIINDGSTDNSLSIAKEYQFKYDFITVISQDNAGLSQTRNLGLSIAKGNYIWFIDSDDWIKENCISNCLTLCELYDLDIFSLDRVMIGLKENSVLATNSGYLQKVISGKICLEEGEFQIPAQLYIFKRQFLAINKLTFFPNILHEDKEFILRAIYFAHKFYFSGQLLYYHLQREGSITQTINPKRCYDLVKISTLATDFINEHEIKDECKKSIIRNSFFSLTLSAILASELTSANVRKDIYRILIKQKSVPWFVFKNDSPINRMEALIFLISPRLFALTHILLKKWQNSLP
jgi:glycosyltransferase involved in cell wall biosynthesis